MKQQIDLATDHVTAVHTSIENTVLNGIPILRVIKKEKINKYDENTFAKVNGLSFHNGVCKAG